MVVLGDVMGIFGFSLLFEALLGLFFLFIYWPDFPYKRLIVNGMIVFSIIAFYGFLGPNYGAGLLEAAWQFILRDLVRVLPV